MHGTSKLCTDSFYCGPGDHFILLPISTAYANTTDAFPTHNNGEAALHRSPTLWSRCKGQT